MSATISTLRTKDAARRAHTYGRPPGWAAHPSNPTPPAENLDPGPPLSFEALHSIAAGLSRTQRAVPDDDADPTTARSIRLIATALYDVWLITWPAGSSLGPHDHGGSRSVLHIVDGELIERFTGQSSSGPPSVRVLRSGDATGAEASFWHNLSNRSEAEATSLHVYSPPLSDLTFFGQFADGRYEQDRTVTVHGQSPQASSKDHDR